MRKDKLYFLTVISIAIVFIVVSVFSSRYFIKSSANQWIELQIISNKKEVTEIAEMIDFQLENEIEKQKIISNLQKIITNSNNENWFISVFDWSGKIVCDPDITTLGQPVNSNQALLASLQEDSGIEVFDILKKYSIADVNSTSEVIHIVPTKNSDLIVAGNLNSNSLKKQIYRLKQNTYFLMLIMGVLVIALSSFAVRIIGSRYEKELELKNTNLTSEVVNLSKLNSDLVSYKEKLIKQPKTEESTELSDTNKKRILTYIRNELVPVVIAEIAYVYTENTITYIVTFEGKKSTSNTSLDDIFTSFDDTIFFRANRQFIISIKAIDKIIRYGNRQLKIVLQNEPPEAIIISKNKAAEFKQWLNI